MGNLTAGGNGKNMMVIWLVEQLKTPGFKPAEFVSWLWREIRPYQLYYCRQKHAMTVAGDEPVLIYHRTGVPVAVAPSRGDAVRRY